MQLRGFLVEPSIEKGAHDMNEPVTNKPILLKGAPVFESVTKAITTYTQNLRVRTPKLVAILTTDNFASHTYVQRKIKACHDVGFTSEVISLRDNPSASLYEIIDQLNKDDTVDGILIQLPLRSDYNQSDILNKIDPNKDVDGFHPTNLGKLVSGDISGFIACTPLGILRLLRHYHIPIEGKHILVVGRSIIVGRPLALLLSQNKPGCNATVTIAHSKTKNLESIARSADIIIAAAGSQNLIRSSFVTHETIIIDVGTNRTERNGKPALIGDVHPECYDIVKAYSPVPGGVGPMTIATLLYNTALSHSRRFNLTSPECHY